MVSIYNAHDVADNESSYTKGQEQSGNLTIKKEIGIWFQDKLYRIKDLILHIDYIRNKWC